MIRQLAHLCFFTDNVDVMIDFYTRLGLDIKFTLQDRNGKTFGYYLNGGNSTFIEVFDQTLAVQEWGGTIQDLKGSSGYRHFCLEVVGLEQYRQKLIQAGIEVTEIKMGMDFSRQAWIQDPNGNAIELMEYTDKSLQLVSQSGGENRNPN